MTGFDLEVTTVANSRSWPSTQSVGNAASPEDPIKPCASGSHATTQPSTNAPHALRHSQEPTQPMEEVSTRTAHRCRWDHIKRLGPRLRTNKL